MTDKNEAERNNDVQEEKKIKKAKARRHKASWSDALILSLLFAGVLFAIYMIERYQ